MNDFDKYLKHKAQQEAISVPPSVQQKITRALDELPNQPPRAKHILCRLGAAVACLLFVALVVLPNLSVSYANALDDLPIIGDIVRVVTSRRYFYTDEHHEMDISVPLVESTDSSAAALINGDVQTLTDALMERFYEELALIGDMGHSGNYVDYTVVTNTTDWFTLKIRVHEAVGSSNTYYKYYHVSKVTDQLVTLGDIASDSRFYGVLTAELTAQMEAQMEENPDLIYWVQGSAFGDELVSIDQTHNFYWDENGALVIPFNKYEIAPGCMGTPEFTISRETLSGLVNEALLPTPAK